jgi:hypothetical protein
LIGEENGRATAEQINVVAVRRPKSKLKGSALEIDSKSLEDNGN